MDDQVDDQGFTLIEVMVSMTVMAVFMAVSTTGILQLYRSTNFSQAIADAQQQLSIAFNRLDREVRYASGISTPAIVDSVPVVEFVTNTTGTPVCTQLRLKDGTLQQRTWTQAGGAVTPTGWVTLATGVSATTAAQPFTVAVADATFNFHRLSVNVVTAAGGTASEATRQFNAMFTALNTSLNTESTTVCSEGRTMA